MRSSSLSFSIAVKTSFSWSNNDSVVCGKRNAKWGTETAAFPYSRFVDLALDETKQRTTLLPLTLQEKFSPISVTGGKAELNLISFKAPKIRLLRSMWIDGNEAMQVLDFAVFPEVQYDLPIFCANFFTSSAMNIIVLDLNPLHDTIKNKEYREKYYKRLMPLVLKYEEAWLDLMEQAVEETDPSKISRNREAQHRYITWRTEKDPGHQFLKKLIGEDRSKELMRDFLFKGLDELGSRTFLDYFPEYRLVDGGINEKRSILGKSFEKRPWSAKGDFNNDGLK